MLTGRTGVKWCATIAIAPFVALWVGGTASAGASGQLSVIPQPSHVDVRSGASGAHAPPYQPFAIRDGTRLSTPRNPRVARVARYFAALLQETRGIKLASEVSGAHSESDSARARSPAIVFRLVAPSVAASPSPEAYVIDVSSDRILLSASDPRGLLYAAVTLWQLCTSAEASAPVSMIQVPAMKITDALRFAWRGLMLDSARHYQSPEFILQLIDWMALHKLNVLHWH